MTNYTEKEIQDKINVLISVQIKTMDKYTAKKYIKEAYKYLLPKKDYVMLAKIKAVEQELLS